MNALRKKNILAFYSLDDGKLSKHFFFWGALQILDGFLFLLSAIHIVWSIMMMVLLIQRALKWIRFTSYVHTQLQYRTIWHSLEMIKSNKNQETFLMRFVFSHFILPSQLRVAALLHEITRFYISIFRFIWETVEFRSKHEHYAYFRLYIKNQQVYCNIDWWLYALGRAKMAGERERKKK